MANNNNLISSSSSSSSRHRWNDDSEWIIHIVRRVEKPIPVDISEIRPCIFKVPKSLSDTKPEAYVPHKIGLGPYHHFREDLYYRMEGKKLDAVKRFLAPANQVLNSQHHLILKLTEHDNIIRVFYEDCCLDLKSEVLAWLLVIDAIFLWRHLSISARLKSVDDKMREWARDIMMAENQIPLVLLWTIRKSVQPSFHFEKELQYAVTRTTIGNLQLEQLHDPLLKNLITFCVQHSPFQLDEEKIIHYKSNHLMGFMYNLIMCQDVQVSTGAPSSMPFEMVVQALSIAEMLGLQEIEKLLSFITSIPWEVILALFRKVYNSNDNKLGQAAVKNIEIPSVSVLCDVGLVKFNKSTNIIGGCIDGIHFKNEDPTFELPVIILNNVDSEVILRNLVAHEELLDRHPSSSRIADYVDLMCGILRTPEDVRLLRKKDIIQGTLADKKIVELFDGISKSTSDTNRESYLKKTIDAVNRHFDNRPKVKARRNMKKCLYASWKLLVFMTTVFTVLNLILKAFCGVYDCNSIFHHKQAVSAIGLEMFPAL